MTTLTPKFYLVGGAVRDSLLNGGASDLDYVVVGATPEWMLANGYKQVGADFPVFLNENGTEFALARTERKTGHGYLGFDTRFDPSVTLEQDLLRRDLTINAMALDGNSSAGEHITLIDPYGGKKDLDNRVLRHVSEAFAEDPVRVLRLARFRARFGEDWSVAPETKTLCASMVEAGELNHLTKERLWSELEKALNTERPDLFIYFLKEVGALEPTFPMLATVSSNVLGSMLRAGSHGSPKLKFAWLMVMFDTATIMDFCNEQRVPSDFMEFALIFRRIAETPINANAKALVEVLTRCGAYRDSILFLNAVTAMDSPVSVLVFHAYLRTADIGFKDLTPNEQTTLKGQAISAAINRLREEKINGL